MADKRATYIPGGNDDFYLPNVISPAPQRVMPEVPGNIQENLAHLELEANPIKRFSDLQSPAPVAEMQGSEPRPFPSRNSSVSTLGNEYGHGYNPSKASNGYQRDQRRPDGGNLDPTFSPFPELKNRPANVPPSDDEREAILERARNPVLNSNDPEMQLTWAQDALAYVEVATQDHLRSSENAASRPQTPQVEHQLRVDAVNVVSFLADQQHPKADFIRGMWLEFGKFNFRMDRREAYHCYTRAARKGYARAEYRIGMQYENSNDPEKAIRHYELGVQARDSASSYRMGMMHLLGQHGKPLDYGRGIQLIRYAAETADENAPQGAYVYGMLQARELPQVDVPEQYLPFDLGAARFHIEKAAYLGFAKAQTKMGASYELCQLGCDFNPAFSLHYNSLAARQGESEADMAISKWFLCGVDGVLEKNEDLAFKYARRAALTGLPTAEFAMGYFNEIGINTVVDLNEAKRWYRKAADHGNKDAASRLEGISRSKTLSKKDHHGAAIAKIQSQYGSHRGKRPDRFNKTSTPMPMPTIADTGTEMPNPNQYASRTGTLQQRPASATPYPEDDLAPQPRPRPSDNSTNSSPDIRLGLNSVGDAPLGPHYRGPSAASMRPSQQYPSQDNLGPGRGRGTPVNNMPGSFGQQGYRQPSSGTPNVEKFGSHLPESPRPQSTGVPGIGYLGPIDSGAPDGGKRLQKRGPPGSSTITSGLRPLPNSTSAPADRMSGQRLSSLPHSQTFAADSRSQAPYANIGRPESAGMPYGHSASRPSSAMQSPAQGSKTPTTRPNGLPAGPMLPPKTPVDRPAPTPPPSIATKPPGKGPKTFEEMGVPQGKREQDCAVEISANLHNKVTKPYAAKTLKELHEQQLIAGKAAGKQLVYHTIQDPKDAASLEELADMDKEIASLRESIATTKANEKLLKANLAAVNAMTSTDELRSQIIALELEKNEILGRLVQLRSGSVKPVSTEAKEEAEKTWRLWSKKAASRKRICLDVWSYCTEELPEGQTKEDLWEELGLEGDE